MIIDETNENELKDVEKLSENEKKSLEEMVKIMSSCLFLGLIVKPSTKYGDATKVRFFYRDADGSTKFVALDGAKELQIGAMLPEETTSSLEKPAPLFTTKKGIS